MSYCLLIYSWFKAIVWVGQSRNNTNCCRLTKGRALHLQSKPRAVRCNGQVVEIVWQKNLVLRRDFKHYFMIFMMIPYMS